MLVIVWNVECSNGAKENIVYKKNVILGTCKNNKSFTPFAAGKTDIKFTCFPQTKYIWYSPLNFMLPFQSMLKLQNVIAIT